MNKKIAIFSVVVITSLFYFLLQKVIAAPRHTGEKIIYAINPVGIAEYNDLGVVELEGRSLCLLTFRTQVLGFDDKEKIYTDPNASLPLRVERNITMWLDKEYIIEEYDQKKYELTIKKYKANKKIKDYFFKEKGPIHNAILLPFYLRGIPELRIGWSFNARLPTKFIIKLISIEEIQVPAGKFTAYHFTSIPHKFEIWISKDSHRVPLEIKSTDGFGYTMVLKEHILK